MSATVSDPSKTALVDALLRADPMLDADEAQHLLSALADPVNRDALVAWQIAEGIVSEAGCWDAPEVTDEQIAEAEDRIEQTRRAFRVARHAAEQAEPTVTESTTLAAITARENRLMNATSEEWEAFESAEHTLEELHETAKRVTVYYEDEDRPDDAVPLYRFNRKGDRG